MKVWSTHKVFDAPWQTIVLAQLRKYPNQFQSAVIGIDTVDRAIDCKGRLVSKRIQQTQWELGGLVSFVKRLIGIDLNRIGIVMEYSIIDRDNQHLQLCSSNCTFSDMFNFSEKMIFSPHPVFPESKTVLFHEASVDVFTILSSYFEDIFIRKCADNSSNGRKAINFIANSIKSGEFDPSRPGQLVSKVASMDTALELDASPLINVPFPQKLSESVLPFAPSNMFTRRTAEEIVEALQRNVADITRDLNVEAI